MARYGNLVDFAPGPVEGSYSFTDTTGRSRVFAGPDAERAAKALEKLKAQEQSQMTAAAPAPASDTRTDAPAPVPGAAGAGGAPGFEPVGNPGGFGGQVPSDFSRPDPAPAAAPATPTTQGPPPSIARETPAPAAGGTGGGTPRLSDGKGGYFVQDEGGQWLHWTPPKAGSKGGLIEKTRSVKGGFERDPEYERTKGELAKADLATVQNAANEQLALSEHLRAAAASEMQAQQQAAEQQRLEMDFTNRRVQEAEALHQRALQDYQSSDTKPEFSTVEQVIGALSAALGAFGAGMTGGENFGLSLVKASVQERVRQEESALSLKKETADNALAQLQRETGSLELAKRSLEGILLKQAENKWRAIASVEQDINKKAEADRQAIAIAGAYEDWLNAYRQAAGGEVTRSLQYVAPTAGSRGGFQLPTIDQAEKLTGLAGKEAANTGAALGNVKTARELESNMPKSEAGQALLGSYRGLDAMATSLSRYAGEDGKPWTPEGQNIAAKTLRGAVDLVAGSGTYKEAMGSDTKLRSDTFNTMRNALISTATQLTGAGAPSEGEAMRSEALAAQSEAQLLNVIRIYKPVIAAKLSAYGVNVPQAPGLRAEE